MSTPICDFVRRYVGGGAVRMHMPGHKGCGPLGFEALDITEIDGADDLFHPEGIIAQSEENAGAIFGAHTLYATGGSTLCIQTMVHLLAVYARSRGQRPLAAGGTQCPQGIRQCRRSAGRAGALALSGGGRSLLQRGRDPRAAGVGAGSQPGAGDGGVSHLPDYLGELPDVAALATVCRRAGVLLAVDNAHGAYLKFLSPSRHPMDLGADLCCDSAHKTLPVVTGGAYLHIAHQAPELLHRQAKASMGLWGSSSPSYLILQSLDAANELLADYPEKLQALLPQLESLRRRLAARGWEVRPGEPAEGDAVSQRVRLHRLGGGGGAGERRHLPGVLRHGSCGADGIASERPGGAAAAGGGAGGAAPAAGHPAGARPPCPGWNRR